MLANPEIKHKSETMLKVIIGLVLDFVFYFLTIGQWVLYVTVLGCYT